MQKIVDFDEWCPKCEFYKLPEEEDPCWDCLNEPSNEDSRKPQQFKERTSKKKSKASQK